MLKKISLILLLFITLNSFGVSYTTVTDECPYIRFSGTTLRDIVVGKSQVKLQQTATKVSVVFLSGGAQTLSWDAPQARSYGYSLDSLYDYILDILKVQCDTSSGGGGSSVNIYNSDGTITDSIRKVYVKEMLSFSDTIQGLYTTFGGFVYPDPLTGVKTYTPSKAINNSLWYLNADTTSYILSTLELNEDVSRTNVGSEILDIVNNIAVGGKASYEKDDGDYYYRLFYRDANNGEHLWLTLGNKQRNGFVITPFAYTPNEPSAFDKWKQPYTFRVADTTDRVFFGTKTEGKIFVDVPVDNSVTNVIGWNGVDSTLVLKDVSTFVTSDSQSLYRVYRSDSIEMGITRGNTITFAYAMDSVSISGDSLITFKGGVRRSFSIGSSGGSSSLSGLTAATATNNINNVSYGQRWQWNSTIGDTSLVLSSTSTSATNNNTILGISTSGAIANTQTTYGLKVINTKASSGGIGIGGYFECNTSGGFAADFNGNTRMLADKMAYFGTGSIYNYSASAATVIEAPTSGYVGLLSKNASGVILYNGSLGVAYMGFPYISSTRHAISFGGDYVGGNFRAVGTSTAVIERNVGNLIFSANTGLGGGYGSYTPTNIMTVSGTSSNVGIGTTTPVASAKLEISTTTQGFLPPRMTTAQRDAISTPAQGLTIFNTTTTKLEVYDGTVWQQAW